MTVARRAWLLPVLLIAFLTLGLPQWLVGGGGPDAPNTEEAFVNLCRAHGGSPTKKARSAANPTARHLCVVRYADRVYVMDAVTPHGWDQDTARYQRVGCEQARRRQGADASRKSRPTFVYRPTTGVCEQRP
jgi:hypothetical protein